MRVLLCGRGHWHHAAMRYFADLMLELYGGVVNTEFMVQSLLNVTQDAFAGRRWNVGDRYMAGECARLRPDAPHVQVVNTIDAINPAHGGFYDFQFYPARSAFEQDVQSFAHNAKA